MCRLPNYEGDPEPHGSLEKGAERGLGGWEGQELRKLAHGGGGAEFKPGKSPEVGDGRRRIAPILSEETDKRGPLNCTSALSPRAAKPKHEYK